MANPVESYFGAGFLGSAITAFFGFLAIRYGRKKSSGEVGDQIATGFGKLVDQLQEENSRHLKQIAALGAESHRLRNQLQKLRIFADLLFRGTYIRV